MGRLRHPASVAARLLDGDFRGGLCVDTVERGRARGAATVVRVIGNEAMLAAALAPGRHFGLARVWGLDLVFEAATGIPHPLEINPCFAAAAGLGIEADVATASYLGWLLSRYLRGPSERTGGVPP